MAVTSIFSSTGLTSPTPHQGKKAGVTSIFDGFKPSAPVISQPQPKTQVNKPIEKPQESILSKASTLIKQSPISAITQTIKGLDIKKIGEALVSGTKSLPGMVKQAAGIIVEGMVAQKDATDRFFYPLKPKYPIDVQVRQKFLDVGKKIREEGTSIQKTVREEYEKTKPTGKGFQGILEMVAFNLPQVIASSGLAVGTAIVTKNPTLSAAIGLSTSYGLGASEVYNEARSQGQSDKQAIPISIVGGALIGALDFAPLGRLLEKTGAVETAKKSIIQNIARGIVSIGAQSGFEGVTESLQEIVGNAIAMTYNQHTNLFQGVPEAGIVGAILGGIGDVTTTSAIGISGKVSDKSMEKKIQKALDTPPEKRTPEQRAIASAILTQDMTPDEAMTYVLKNKLGNKEVGKKIVLTVLEAKRQDKHIRISPAEGEKDIQITLIDPNEPLQVTTEAEMVDKSGQETKDIKIKFDRAVSTYVSDEGVYKKPDGTMAVSPALTELADIAKTPEAQEITKQKVQEAIDSGKITVNEDGTITAYRVGSMPEEDRLVSISLSGSAAQDFADQASVTGEKRPINRITIKPEDIKVYVGGTEDEALIQSQKAPVTKEGEKKELYDYQSTQLDIPADVAKEVTGIAAKIPDEQISVDPDDPTIGREKAPHITVAYGLSKDVTEEMIREVIADQKPIEVTLGKTSIFENEKYDVLKVDVTSPELSAINKRIEDDLGLPGKTFDGYEPHITIAYLKKGEAQQYAGDASLEGKKVTLDTLTFSKTTGETMEIPLSGVASKPEDGTPSPTLEKPPEVTTEPKKETKPKETVVVPSKETPVGTGKKKNSRLYERVKEALGAEYDAKEVKYNQLSLDSQADKVVDLIESDPEKAVRIARGFEEPSAGMTQNAVAVALAEIAASKGDGKTAADLWTKTSLRSTRLGQEIVSLRGEFTVNESLNAVKKLVTSRMEQVGKRYSDIIKGLSLSEDSAMIKKVDALVKHEAKKVKKIITEQQKRIQSAQEIINQLKCK
jgi:2'-5' RNA ligase